MILLQGVEEAFGSIRVDRAELPEKILHLGPFGFAVGRAGGRNDGQRQRFLHMLHMGFRKVDQGP